MIGTPTNTSIEVPRRPLCRENEATLIATYNVQSGLLA